ncbi:hypothetical protein B0H17DRAFT_640820 [Mycena rosella]|uniref:F-box domain-containing protein n=1 Tax=Mycena rosella TaxID=1033263 RepID=A0AAD7GDI5_MYCRO|nr:hypothetical protein B0H17DRAFT_640820 [Mycena rosella]
MPLKHSDMDPTNGRGLTVRDRIRHNVLPSETERQAIIESVAATEARLSEMAATGATRDLEAEGNNLRQYISDCSSLAAAIRSLSHDILETIFLDTQIHGIVNIRRVASDSSLVVDGRNPDVLASVSHHWRSVALATPRLWSSIRVKAGVTRVVQHEDAKHTTFDPMHGTSASNPVHLPTMYRSCAKHGT